MKLFRFLLLLLFLSNAYAYADVKKYPGDFGLNCNYTDKSATYPIILIYSPKNNVTWIGQRTPNDLFRPINLIYNLVKTDKEIKFNQSGPVSKLWTLDRSTLDITVKFYFEYLKRDDYTYYNCDLLPDDDFISSIKYSLEKYPPPPPPPPRAPNKL
jgi:hypothetical protein